MRNKYKMAFWICFTTLLITGAIGLYAIVDQGVTITYMKESYEYTQSDLNSIIEMVEKTDQSKGQIKKVLKNHRLYEYMDFESDTVHLEKTSLIFYRDTLKRIETGE